MKKFLTPIILFFFFALPLPNSLASDLAGQYFKNGTSLYDQAKYDQALIAFQKAAQEDPNYAEAYYNQGVVYDLQSRFPEAIKAYQKVIQINPNVGTVLENLAQDCYAAGNLRQAMDYIKLAESMGKPIDKSFYNQMWAEYKGISKVHGKKLAVYTKPRELEQVDKDLESAIVSLEKELRTDSGELINLGLKYRQKGEIDKSIDIFNKALKLNANKMMIYAELGLCYYFKNRKDLFVQNFRQAKKIGFQPSKSLNDLYLQCAVKK